MDSVNNGYNIGSLNVIPEKIVNYIKHLGGANLAHSTCSCQVKGSVCIVTSPFYLTFAQCFS